MVKHVQESHTLHAFEKIATLQKEVSTLRSDNQSLVNTLTLIMKRLDSLEQGIKSCTNTVDVDSASRKTIPKESATEEASSSNVHQLHRGITTADSMSYSYTSKRAGFNSDHSGTMHDDSEKDGITVNASSVQRSIKHIMRTVESQQNKLAHIGEQVQEVQQNMTHHMLVLDDLRLRQDILDVKATGGVFIWKIPDVRRRYKEAIESKTLSLYSPPFFTSPHGYRMCIRAYLNGDGLGKGTHLSVFFVLMRSEHDSILPWPFKQTVRFTLINQKDNSKSITEAFKPDLHSSSFQKPKSDMNIASGFPLFAQQSVLRDDTFTTDGTIFIKVEVDLGGLSMH